MSDQAMRQAITWLAKLNSPDLTEQQQKDFFEWLEAKPEHQAAYLKAEQLWLRADVFERIAPLSEPVARSRKTAAGPWLSWGAGVAACTLLICVFIFSQTFTAPTIVAGEWQYVTAVGQQETIALPDGSELVLNTDTEMTVIFDAHRRLASLQHGEAFFSVKPESGERPFDVVTPAGAVRVLGTRFSVRRLRSSDDASVTVVEGRVALNPSIKNEKMLPAFDSKSVLQNNQLSSMRAVQQGLAPVSIDAANALAWREQRLVFNAQPLVDVVAELNRYSSEPITLSQAELASIEVTAVLPLNNIEQTLQALAETIGLSVDKQGSARVLIPSR